MAFMFDPGSNTAVERGVIVLHIRVSKSRKRGRCGNGEEEREGCCIEGATARDYIHKRAE
jgi:hypothetical protein